MNKQMEGFSFFLSYLYLAVTKYNISGELKIHSRLVCSLCPHLLRLKGKKQKSHKLPNEQSKTHITHLHLNRFFWRDHSFPIGWAKGLWGKKKENAPQTAQGQLVQSKDVDVLAIFPLLLLPPESTGMPTEQRLEESQVLIPSSVPNSPVQLPARQKYLPSIPLQNLIQENGGMWVSIFFFS